jgi:hypothetical protein
MKKLIVGSLLGFVVAAFILTISGYVDLRNAYAQARGAAFSLITTLSFEDKLNSVGRVENQWEYEDIAASQTDQPVGATGASGDLFNGAECIFSADPSVAVTLKDGAAGSPLTLFVDPGAAAERSKQGLGWVSVSGGWFITTGTNTICRVSGRFS